MFSISKLNKILPFVKIELFNKQNCFFLENYIIKTIFIILKYHFKYYFKILSSISALDFVINKNRFKLIYDILSLKFNNRLRLKISFNENFNIFSIENIFINSVWWEYECWDMMGIIFIRKKNSIRLLTDYGFQGFPLRKDFPITGYIESKYNLEKNRICYYNLELSQNYRIFSYKSPWDNFIIFLA